MKRVLIGCAIASIVGLIAKHIIHQKRVGYIQSDVGASNCPYLIEPDTKGGKYAIYYSS